MFVASSLFFGGADLVQRLRSDSDPRAAITGFVDERFPLSNDLKELYTDIMDASGRERFGDIYLTSDRLIKLSDSYDEDKLNENVELINDFASHTSVPVWIMLSPTASGVYYDELSPYINVSRQKEAIDNVYLSLDKSIGAIDVYYPIYSARDEYVYYRTSDCWTSFGAYCAYIESVKQLGLEAQTLGSYDQEYAASSYKGELYEQVRSSSVEADRINIFRSKYQSPVESVILSKKQDDPEPREARSVYFKSALKTQNKNDVFLMGDKYERADIYTSNSDLPKLLVIKGSYANTLMPFYTAHYSMITLIDPRQLAENNEKLTDLVTLKDYDQILFMTDISSFAQCSCLDNLR